MPLTKSDSLVINIEDVSTSIAANGVNNGVKDYIDEQITIVSNNLSTGLSTLTTNYQNADIALSNTITSNHASLSSAIQDEIDARIAAITSVRSASVPVGTIVLWPKQSAGLPDPSKYGYYTLCDGTMFTIPFFEYHPLFELYEILGRQFSLSSDSSTTFRVPNFGGRVPIGQGSTTDTRGETLTFSTVGGTGGEFKHVLSVPELPSHTHDLKVGTTDTSRDGNVDGGAGNRGDMSGLVKATGSNFPHQNTQPYIIMRYLIKVSHTNWNV